MTPKKDDNPAVSLPRHDGGSRVAVGQAIGRRRSIRRFGDEPLALSAVSGLLWAGQGVTDPDSLRAAPSAGGLYPLEIYLVAGAVDTLPAGLYRYRGKTHDLVGIRAGELRNGLASAALDQDWLRRAPALLVITAEFARTTSTYGRRGHRYVHMEVGCVAENMSLQATALDLATVFVGAFDDARVRDTLGLPDGHEPLCIMPVGHRA